MQSRGPETRNPLGSLSQVGPGTQALVSKWLREGRKLGPRLGMDTGHCSFHPMVPEIPPSMLGPPGSQQPPGSHPHTDLLLGCQQALQAGCSSSAPLCLVPVPALDGDGSLVHLVDKPAQKADSGPRQALCPTIQLGPRRPSWAEKPADVRTACLQVADIPRPHKPVTITRNWKYPQGYHLPVGGHCLRRRQMLLVDREQQTASAGHTRPQAVCSKHGTV